MENLKSGFEFIFASYKRTAAILFIGALTLAIPITITLVGQQQDIRQRAQTTNNVISGTVFIDNNGDGDQDSGEADYSGNVTIKLENGTTATKYGNGFYFTNVASGTHTVTLTEPSGYIKTTPTSASVTVPPSPGTFKFGIKSTATTNNVISGTVFIDNNGDGDQDSGEADYSGNVTIKLETGVTATQAFGTGYYFTGVASGSHTVTLTEPSGYTKTTPTSVSVTVPPDRKFEFGIKSTSAPTATRIPSLSPTITRTPTPTGIPPGTSNLSVSITLTGIGVSQNPASGINNNPKRPQRNVEVTILNSGNQQVDLTKSTVDYDPTTGKYKGNVNLGNNFVSGSYLVKVRLDNTLWKTIQGIQNITSGQIYNAPEAALVSGDIVQDNEINLLDYNALLSCFGTQACATKAQADLNDDDRVEELDINILYAGFARRVGD